MRGITRNQETEPAAVGLLAGLAVLLIAAAALVCGDGCARYTTLPSTPRLLSRQPDTVVKVEAFCVEDDPFTSSGALGVHGGTGSGVILDARHVLTADHVVECPYLPDVHVITADGHRFRVLVKHEDATHDLALLEIQAALDSFGDVAPPVIGPRPLVGDAVCKLEAVPARGGDCGHVTETSDEPGADVGFDAPVKHGNSGGPVYDAEGRLVGITTRLIPPDGDAGGRFTSLTGRAEIMP